MLAEESKPQEKSYLHQLKNKGKLNKNEEIGWRKNKMGFLKELKRRFTPGYAKEEYDLIKEGYSREEAERIIDESRKRQKYLDSLPPELREIEMKTDVEIEHILKMHEIEKKYLEKLTPEEQLEYYDRQDELKKIEEEEEARERGRRKAREGY